MIVIRRASCDFLSRTRCDLTAVVEHFSGASSAAVLGQSPWISRHQATTAFAIEFRSRNQIMPHLLATANGPSRHRAERQRPLWPQKRPKRAPLTKNDNAEHFSRGLLWFGYEKKFARNASIRAQKQHTVGPSRHLKRRDRVKGLIPTRTADFFSAGPLGARRTKSLS